MGIRFSCPNGHKLNVKAFLAGKRGVCPHCGAKFVIPTQESPLGAQDLQADTGGQPHTIDVASPTSEHTDGLSGSPSVIITASDADASPQVDWGGAAIPAPEQLSPTLPPAIVPAAPSPLTAAPIAKPTPANLSQRDRNRGKQLAISVVLLLVVIVLAVVLVVVLRRNTGRTNGGKVAAAYRGNMQQAVRMATDGQS
jgi:hypothetical protein